MEALGQLFDLGAVATARIAVHAAVDLGRIQLEDRLRLGNIPVAVFPVHFADFFQAHDQGADGRFSQCLMLAILGDQGDQLMLVVFHADAVQAGQPTDDFRLVDRQGTQAIEEVSEEDLVAALVPEVLLLQDFGRFLRAAAQCGRHPLGRLVGLDPDADVLEHADSLVDDAFEQAEGKHMRQCPQLSGGQLLHMLIVVDHADERRLADMAVGSGNDLVSDQIDAGVNAAAADLEQRQARQQAQIAGPLKALDFTIDQVVVVEQPERSGNKGNRLGRRVGQLPADVLQIEVDAPLDVGDDAAVGLEPDRIFACK